MIFTHHAAQIRNNIYYHISQHVTVFIQAM